MKRTKRMKKFKVYYFLGEDKLGYEKRKCTIISAMSEYEAEYIFKRFSGITYDSFGWVEEIEKTKSPKLNNEITRKEENEACSKEV